jgi:methylmalonyl-CoA/ethylmalonyl-CoA epimerase
MGWMGRVQLELIQVRGSGSIHADFLEEGREGLHHLGFFVNNLEERLAACRARGIGVLQRGTLKRMGLTIDYAYLDTVKIGGAIIEFIQTRFLGFNVPQSRLLMKPFSRLQRVFGR